MHKQVKTIIKPFMNTYSFDYEINQSMNAGWYLVKRDVISNNNTMMLYAFLSMNTKEKNTEY